MDRRTVGTRLQGTSILGGSRVLAWKVNLMQWQKRQQELEAHLLRPHDHCQRPLSAVFSQTDPLSLHFLLLTTEAEGIPLDH